MPPPPTEVELSAEPITCSRPTHRKASLDVSPITVVDADETDVDPRGTGLTAGVVSPRTPSPLFGSEEARRPTRLSMDWLAEEASNDVFVTCSPKTPTMVKPMHDWPYSARGCSSPTVHGLGGSLAVMEWSNLSTTKVIGSGVATTVLLAELDGHPQPVVVKHLTPACACDKQHQAEMENEVELLSTYAHKSLVVALGAGWAPGRTLFGGGATPPVPVRFLVTELLNGGTLADRTLRLRHENPGGVPPCGQRFAGFSCRELFPHIRDLAAVLAFLHGINGERAASRRFVMHRDLKAANVGFLDGRLKLLDLGLARRVTRSEDTPRSAAASAASATYTKCYRLTPRSGTLRYMSPEIASGSEYNASADVYSFAFLAWEMAAGVLPFAGSKPDWFEREVINGATRPGMGTEWPPSLRETLGRCWQKDPTDRPTMTEVSEVATTWVEAQERGEPKFVDPSVCCVIS